VLKYLRQGKLAYIFGETLFLHGAIDSEKMVVLSFSLSLSLSLSLSYLSLSLCLLVSASASHVCLEFLP
jgi:hypothetical protein